MMALNSLLKYNTISILLLGILLLAGSAFAGELLENFEDVSDWTFGEDIGAFTTDTTKKIEGSNSGKITIDDNFDGSGFIKKDPVAVLDLSTTYQFVNFSLWIDTDAWTGQTGVLTMKFADLNTNPCSTNSIPLANFNDEAWTSFSYNLTNAAEWNELDCNFSEIDWFKFEFYTDVLTPTNFAWIDYFYAFNGTTTTDSCTAPASGDWKIEDNCTLGEADTITGDLNITAGSSLNITNGGTLTVQGGEIYIWTPGVLRIESGGQING